MQSKSESHALSRQVLPHRYAYRGTMSRALHDERPSLNARRIVAALARIEQRSICLRDHACVQMPCSSPGFIPPTPPGPLGLVVACQ